MKERQIASLLRIAHQDLQGSKVLYSIKNRNAYYLCEQAAEKIIRAVLTSEGINGGREHRLDWMVAQIPESNPIRADLTQVVRLTAYATTYRYPTESGRVPTPTEDLSGMLDQVERLLREACHRFGVDLGADTVARSAAPFR